MTHANHLRLRALLDNFKNSIEQIAETSSDVPRLLADVERGLERAGESITKTIQ
jgi:hypothetical protein